MLVDDLIEIGSLFRIEVRIDVAGYQQCYTLEGREPQIFSQVSWGKTEENRVAIRLRYYFEFAFKMGKFPP
jgi:hypothetical protein